MRAIEGWDWDARFKLYTRKLGGLVLGCVSMNMSRSGGWTAAYNGETLRWYGLEKDVFTEPEEAAKAVEDFARTRGWNGS